jgi:Ribosomal proteins 50S-L15, 50S-L18e, 60S-L27A
MPQFYQNYDPCLDHRSIPLVSVEVPETKRVKRQVGEQKVKIPEPEGEMPTLKEVKRRYIFDFQKLDITLRMRGIRKALMNRRRLDMTPVNLDSIQKAIDAGDIDPNLPITMKTPKEAKIVNKIGDGVKLLGRVSIASFLTDNLRGKKSYRNR